MSRSTQITVVAQALTDGIASLVNIAPTEMVVFTEEGDWALVGGDFRSAIDTVAEERQRIQPSLPFSSNELVEAK